MIELCNLCEECFKKIGRMFVYTAAPPHISGSIPVYFCDICGKQSVHLVEKRTLLRVMMEKIEESEKRPGEAYTMIVKQDGMEWRFTLPGHDNEIGSPGVFLDNSANPIAGYLREIYRSLRNQSKPVGA